MNEIVNVMIRTAAPADAREIVDISHLSWLSTYIPLGVPDEAIEGAFQNLDTRITRTSHYIEKLDQLNMIGLVAVNDGVVVGYCFGNKEVDFYEVNQLYIHPDYVDRGVGTSLLKSFLEITAGSTVRVCVYSKNIKALKFYMTAGFIGSEEKSSFKLSEKVVLNEKVLYLKRNLS